MRLLLDTHGWLWMHLEPKRLGPRTRALLEDLDNELFLSTASVWEIVIKAARGKLRLPNDAVSFVRTRIARSAIAVLPISLDHVLAVSTLPTHHTDPFDRVLIAQAHVESMTLVTPDENISRYAVISMDARS